MLAVGIYVLSRPKRLELAGELAREGWTGADVQALADYLRAAIDDAGLAQRQLAGRITRADGRADTLADLRRRGPAPDQAQTPGEWIRKQNVERARVAEEEWRRYCDDIATGRVARLPRLLHPWERRRNAQNEGGAA